MPQVLMLGEAQDSDNNRFSITPSERFHQLRSRDHLVHWNPANQYAIALNDSINVREARRPFEGLRLEE